jgi:hypothetical protein
MDLMSRITTLVFPPKLLAWVMSRSQDAPPQAVATPAANAPPVAPAPLAGRQVVAPTPTAPAWWPTTAPRQEPTTAKIITLPTPDVRHDDTDVRSDELEDDELIEQFEMFIDSEGPAAATSDEELMDVVLPKLIQGFLDWLPNKHVGYHSGYKDAIARWLKEQDFLRRQLLVGYGEPNREETCPPPAQKGSNGSTSFPSDKESFERWLRGTA